MAPQKLMAVVRTGDLQTFPKGQVFHALDFKDEVYMVKSGYVKRYAVTKENKRVIESIYGPGYLFPLSGLYKKLMNFNLNQESNTYVYQAMTDLEINAIPSEELEKAIKDSSELYADLFYEAGRRLKANINRLASNALQDDYRKVAHQLTCLAEEFGDSATEGVKAPITIPVPLEPVDMAEQLNISLEVSEAVLNRLEGQGLIETANGIIKVPDMNLLKDAYLDR